MKRKLFLALILLAALPACRTRYQVTLNNAARITAAGKPRLENGYYVFNDAVSGKRVEIPSGRVIEIEALPLWGKPKEEFKSSPKR